MRVEIIRVAISNDAPAVVAYLDIAISGIVLNSCRLARRNGMLRIQTPRRPRLGPLGDLIHNHCGELVFDRIVTFQDQGDLIEFRRQVFDQLRAEYPELIGDARLVIEPSRSNDAPRRIDELRRAQAETVGLNPGAQVGLGPRRVAEKPADKPTLASQGIDKNLAHQARSLGKLSDEPRRVQAHALDDDRDGLTRMLGTTPSAVSPTST